MKQEDCGPIEYGVPETTDEPNIPVSEPSSSRARTPKTPKTPRRSSKKTKNLETPTQDPSLNNHAQSESTPQAENIAVPRKRGRPRGSTRANREASLPSKTTTKAGIAGTNESGAYSYSDLFMADDDQDLDENVDAGDEDSEYAPSDEEVARKISAIPRRRRGVSAGTRRQSRNKSIVDEIEEGGSTDEDEAGESESEDEEDEDEDYGDATVMQDSMENGGPISLFEDDNNQMQRDIYDFDAQSIISDKRTTTTKKRVPAQTSTRTAGGTSSRTGRRTRHGRGTSWGSNIYSALAASLKTRADLDAYSNFLKCSFLNTTYDQFLAKLCKPSNQHVSLFYGASASLQSLMSRINDHDKVVELLHAFVSRPYEDLQHRVIYLVPIIHQPIFGAANVTSLGQVLDSISKSVDADMVIKAAYILDSDTNLLAIPGAIACDFGVSTTQYNCITSTGNMGRYMPDIKHLIIPTDLYQRLNEMVALPPDRIYEVALARAHQQSDEADIDISPLEPPNLQRIVLAVSSEGTLLGIAILDTWNRTEIPFSQQEPIIHLINPDTSCNVATGLESRNTRNDLTIEEQVKEVLDNVIDWVVLKSDPKSLPKRPTRNGSSVLGTVHFMDAFLVKPNGRRDTLLLVANRNVCQPPLDDSTQDCEPFRVYYVLDESRFALEKHGFTPDMPISLEGVHSVDPDEVVEEKSLLVVPDLLFDTLRKVMLRELVSSTGTAAAAAVVTSSTLGSGNLSVNASGAAAMIRCTKFVILDQHRRVPLAIAFDSPVRLSLHIKTDELGVHPFGNAASEYFDQVTPADLKACEHSFKPTTAEYRLVSINGLLFGLQIDDKQVIRRVLEIVPARFAPIYPHVDHPDLCAQSVLAAHQSCPSNVRIINDETNSSTVLPAFYYPHQEQGKLTNTISGFVNCLCNSISALPVTISLYDVVLRMAQKYMPEILARQHIEAAEAAAYAEAAANPHAPPPEPVPLPEHWGVCCICAKELRSLNGLLDHEMRHMGLSRFRCVVHNVYFLDRRSWQMHMNEYHATARPSLPAALARINPIPQTDSGSEHDDDDEDVEQEGVPGSGLLAGLANVFKSNLLLGRMEAPQCEKCSDNFPAAEILAQHLDFCDGVSFSVRTPIPRAATNKSNIAELSTVTDANEESTQKEDVFVCGLCGIQVSSRDKLLRHFTAYHLQCIICSQVLRSIEELSCHYQGHLRMETTDSIQDNPNGDASQVNEIDKGETESKENHTVNTNNKSGSIPKHLLAKLMTCDICSDFYGTKYNYYFHQWTDHGVVHPPVGSIDGTPSQAIEQVRHFKSRLDRDDMFAPPSTVRRMKCKLCDVGVRVTGKDYMIHLSKEHGVIANPDVICRICAELFETPDDLSAHLGEHHAPTGEYTNAGVQTIFRCSHCDFWGFSKSLIRHSREVHLDSNPSIYECVHCYERFSDKRVWRTHLDKHNEGYSHRCLECGRAFRLRPSLQHHIRTHHSDDQGPATCDYCGLTYPKRSSLRYHVFRMHNQELAHECLMCQRRFRLETELRRHVKEMHSGAVKCEICHKVCSNLRCYAQHRQKHFRTRIYQCTDCQTTFKSKLAMKRHIRVEHLQLGPEKFECQICGKIVTQIGMHMLIHKEARFECEYCNKRFTKAAYYNEHLRIHRGEQPFECHICRKRFNKKSNLNVHLRFHEKHRDEEGNYLELKPRGRISTMFGDANMSASERAARLVAIRAAQNSMFVPRVDACVGSDLPGAFNCTGPAGAAAEAASRIADLYGINENDENHMDNRNYDCDSLDSAPYEDLEPALKRQRHQTVVNETDEMKMSRKIGSLSYDHARLIYSVFRDDTSRRCNELSITSTGMEEFG